MKNQTVFLLLACLGFVAVATAQEVYCGRRLSQALNVVCDGHLIKRSDPALSSFDPTSPWISAAQAHTMAFRRKRQIVEECCEKPCTVSELQSYCGF